MGLDKYCGNSGTYMELNGNDKITIELGLVLILLLSTVLIYHN